MFHYTAFCVSFHPSACSNGSSLVPIVCGRYMRHIRCVCLPNHLRWCSIGSSPREHWQPALVLQISVSTSAKQLQRNTAVLRDTYDWDLDLWRHIAVPVCFNRRGLTTDTTAPREWPRTSTSKMTSAPQKKKKNNSTGERNRPAPEL